MNKKKKIKLNVCGYATNREFLPAGQPAKNTKQSTSQLKQSISLSEQQEIDLIELANNRANTIKRYFIDNGFDGKRLILCAAEIDESDSAIPRVDFSL